MNASHRNPIAPRSALPALLSLCCLAPQPARAFGALGHQVIAALAEDMLTPGAEAQVREILAPAGGAPSLASVSTWADDIREQRPETRPWHYVTIQIGEARYDSAHADSVDVVKALKRELAILAEPDADMPVRAEALKWTVHLVGDLHQPLHAGEDRDKGGNLEKVKVNGRGYNLHAVWDFVLLERLHIPADTLRDMLEKEIAADPGFIPRNASGTVEAWTDETHAKAAACYRLDGRPMPKGIAVRLDREYLDASTLVVLEQLKLAGVRLALVLNRALDPRARTRAVAPAKPAPGWHADKAAFFRHADAITD